MARLKKQKQTITFSFSMKGCLQKSTKFFFDQLVTILISNINSNTFEIYYEHDFFSGLLELKWTGISSFFFLLVVIKQHWGQSSYHSRTHLLLPHWRVMWFKHLVWIWILVIFLWLFFLSINTTLIDDWTIWTWLLTYAVPLLNIRWKAPLTCF